ncbi:unnamed protein product [Lactuca virosa]|uniref:WRC domain-containing protein n=1 Tax=Lactuca virosa TaxID=75947 RepID=A0AAU9PAY1_9ASTR|nr:unnamed protein product [Lactuca virosa]
MRIRKRFLSLSAAITAPPSSDPHGGDHQLHKHQQPLLLVQQQVHPNGNLRVLYDNTQSQPFDPPLNHRVSHLPPPSSDHSTQIGFQTTAWTPSGAGSEPKHLIVSPHKELESEKEETIKTSDTCRKESIVCAEASSRVHNTASLPPPPTTSHLVLKGWFEGDRLIPIKKRRGSFGKGSANHGLEEDNEMIIDEGTMKPKPKKYAKYMATCKEVNTSTTYPKNKKNGKRGNVIMEGSRCSRVNGRGWRCCQQTLVGYSLCEHHLGKGRLRSMNSVRGRAQKVKVKEQDQEVEMTSMDHTGFEDDKDWEEESVSSMEGMKKLTKKKKLGVVKARSLSSLLSQIGS